MEGWLYKKRPDGEAALRTWKKRWHKITLTGPAPAQEIEYFKQERGTKRKGVVDLRRLLRVTPITTEDLGWTYTAKSHPHGFTLTCEDRRYHLLASSPEEKTQWLRAIHDLCPTAKFHYQIQCLIGVAQSASTGALASSSAASLLGLSPPSPSKSTPALVSTAPVSVPAAAAGAGAGSSSPGNPFAAMSSSAPGKAGAWPSVDEAAASAAAAEDHTAVAEKPKKKGLFGRIGGGGGKATATAPAPAPAPAPASAGVVVAATTPAVSPGNPFGSPTSSSAVTTSRAPSTASPGNPFADFGPSSSSPSSEARVAAVRDALFSRPSMVQTTGSIQQQGSGEVRSTAPDFLLRPQQQAQQQPAKVSSAARLEGDDSDADNEENDRRDGARRQQKRASVAAKRASMAPKNSKLAADGAAIPLIDGEDEDEDDGDLEAGRHRKARAKGKGKGKGKEEDEEEDEGEGSDSSEDEDDDDEEKKGCCAKCIVQ